VPEPSGPLPAGFDPATASSIFHAGGTVDEVAAAYVEDVYDIRTPTLTPAVVEGRQATVHWQFGEDDDGEGVPDGDLLLRRDQDGWAVVAATVEGLDLSSLRNTGDRVTGEVRRVGEENVVFVDLLDAAGQPIVDTIEDDDGPRREVIPVDVPVAGPAIVRVRILGGTILGVGEFALEPPPVEIEGPGGSTVTVQQRLGETCVGIGSGPGLGSGAGWVCRPDDPAPWPDGVWYLELGPTTRHDFQVLVTGFVHPAVESIQLRREDGTELDVSTSRVEVGNGAYVVAAVPLVDGPLFVDLRGSTGVLDTVGLSGLLPVGG
jgi:hypothetical protein